MFVGSGIFKAEDPTLMARAIVEATANFEDAGAVAKVSRGLGAAMPGQEMSEVTERLSDRGW